MFRHRSLSFAFFRSRSPSFAIVRPRWPSIANEGENLILLKSEDVTVSILLCQLTPTTVRERGRTRTNDGELRRTMAKVKKGPNFREQLRTFAKITKSMKDERGLVNLLYQYNSLFDITDNKLGTKFSNVLLRVDCIPNPLVASFQNVYTFCYFA